MVTLDAMFPAVQKKRLLKAAESRYACRAFAGALSTGDWAAMSYVAQRYALPGARLMLLHVPESLFTGTLLNMGRVSGCTAVAAVIADSAVAQSRIHAGVLGEALCLEATAQGLGSCWIHRAREEFATPEGQALLQKWGVAGNYIGVGHCLLGYPAAAPNPRVSRKPDYIVRP